MIDSKLLFISIVVCVFALFIENRVSHGFLRQPICFLALLYTFFFIIFPSGCLDNFYKRHAEKRSKGPRILSKSELIKLIPHSIRFRHLADLRDQGHLSEEIKTALEADCIAQASVSVDGATVTEEALKSIDISDLSDVNAGVLSRVRGVLSFTNVIWVIASILFILAAHNLIILFILPIIELWKFIRDLPAEFKEAIVYLLCFFAIAAGSLYEDKSKEIGNYRKGLGGYVSLIGCFGVMYAIYHTASVHGDPRQADTDLFFQIAHIFCILVFVPTAIFYQSVIIGWLSVISVQSLLGFYAGSFGLGFYIGFVSRGVIVNAAFASLAMLIIFSAPKINPKIASFFPEDLLGPFSPPGLFMGTFVYFLACLIVSSWFYSWGYGPQYGIANAIALVSGICALYVGNVYNIPRIRGVGGTFFILWGIEKYVELPFGEFWWSFGLLGLSIILYVISLFIRTHPEYVIGVLKPKKHAPKAL